MKSKKKFFMLLLVSLLFLSLSFFGIYRYIQYREYIKASPYDILVSDVSADSVTISWKTDIDTPTFIKLGESEKLWGNEKYTRFHSVRLSGLKESSKYSFSISDGREVWEEIGDISSELSKYILDDLSFTTSAPKEEVSLPEVRELNVLPNEYVYVSLYNKDTGEYSDVKSYTANRFGGIAVDINSFNISGDNLEILDIGYFTAQRNNSAKESIDVYAAEINCNQDVSKQTINGINKEQFADLATRWVAGRGKHYALECFNDVVYRAKKKGVDPAFALTIWLNESGASNYTQNASLSGLVEDFGIHGLSSVPVQNFNKQIEHFLTLSHNYTCKGLTSWEAWGNIYKWGSCNENDPVKRQQGIDYYKGIEQVYEWVTDGRKLPAKVTGLPVSGGDEDSGGGESEEGSLCCALKIDNREAFRGDYENGMEGKTCDDVWKVGRTVYGGKIEYSVEIKNKNKSACEVDYTGVCCELANDVKWYPKSLCSKTVPNIKTSKECNGLKKDLSVYKITLQKGINFVGFDFTPSYKNTEMYASNLIEIYPDILLIGNFEGYEWKDLIKKSEKLPFAGSDFYFEQNKGYLIVSSEAVTIELDGWKDSTLKYSELNNGWNLVGGTLYTKSNKASSLIQSLSTENISVDTVGVWSTELGRFNYRREEESNIYGEDITLKSNEGIFLKKK